MTHSEKRLNRQLDYQEAFAKRLVNTMGFEGAVRECYENQWLGTLIYVQRLKSNYQQ